MEVVAYSFRPNRVTSQRLCKSAPFRVDFVISYLKHYISTFASYILFYPQLKPQITHGLLYIFLSGPAQAEGRSLKFYYRSLRAYPVPLLFSFLALGV